MNKLDRRVIACNYTETTNICPKGGLAYVWLTNPGGGNDRIPLIARSHSGRWVHKWESMKRLENFRFKTLPPEHPRFKDHEYWRPSEQDLQWLQEACEYWNSEKAKA
jgi:hypothetical protein